MSSASSKRSGSILWIKNPRGVVFWDVHSFRPNMKDILTDGVSYVSSVRYELRNLSSGKEVRVVKSVSANGTVFENVR